MTISLSKLSKKTRLKIAEDIKKGVPRKNIALRYNIRKSDVFMASDLKSLDKLNKWINFKYNRSPIIRLKSHNYHKKNYQNSRTIANLYLLSKNEIEILIHNFGYNWKKFPERILHLKSHKSVFITRDFSVRCKVLSLNRQALKFTVEDLGYEWNYYLTILFRPYTG